MPRFDLERYQQAKRDGSPEWVAWALGTPWAYFLAMGVVGALGAWLWWS